MTTPRRIIVAVLLINLVAAFGVVIWHHGRPRQAAVSYLRVHPVNSYLVGATGATLQPAERETIAALATSPVVLGAVLADEGLAEFVNSVKDPLSYLQGKLEAKWQGASDLLVISMEGTPEQVQQCTTIVDIVATRLVEYLCEEESQRRGHILNLLNSELERTMSEIRKLEGLVRQLSKIVGEDADEGRSVDREFAQRELQQEWERLGTLRDRSFALQMEARAPARIELLTPQPHLVLLSQK